MSHSDLTATNPADKKDRWGLVKACALFSFRCGCISESDRLHRDTAVNYREKIFRNCTSPIQLSFKPSSTWQPNYDICCITSRLCKSWWYFWKLVYSGCTSHYRLGTVFLHWTYSTGDRGVLKDFVSTSVKKKSKHIYFYAVNNISIFACYKTSLSILPCNN